MGRPKIPDSKKKSIIFPIRGNPETKKFIKEELGTTPTKIFNEAVETKLINAAIAKEKEIKKWLQSQKHKE